jgi:RHS repeat-associated protein
MSEFLINGILQAQYKYDAMGRQAIRTLTSPTAVTIHSVFDSDGRRIAEYNETSGALIREYVWNGWEPVAVIEGGVISFVRADHIGRPVFATNASGVKIWTATYTPFGGVHTSTGAPPSARFPGQWFQSESGLHQNWMRDYDPTTGRYLQADPLGLIDGASVYGYAGQSPMMLIDPTGEFIPLGPMLAGAAIGAGLALLEELWRNEGRWECINWFTVGIGGGLGAIGGAYGQGLMKGLGLAHRGGDAAARKAIREAFGAGADDVAHHGLLAAGRGVNGVGPSLRHHFMNFRGLSKSAHKRVHGKRDLQTPSGVPLQPFSALGRYLHGVPPWLHGATGFPALGGITELIDSEDQCICMN